MKKLLISILSGIIFITNATSIYANAPGVVELGKIDDVTSAIKFSEEMAAIEQEDLWGFIDKTGSIIIAPQYSFVHSFQNGVAWVRKDEHTFFINKKGDTVIDGWKDCDFSFGNGLLAVKNDNGKWGYVDNKGNVIIEPYWDDACTFSNELAAVSQNDKYGYINTQGELLIEPAWDMAYEFNDSGIAMVIENKDNAKIGFINEKGEYVIEPQYTACRGYGENLLTVCKNGKWGFIDVDGNTIIEPQYTDASVFSNGLANVETEEDIGAYINKDGNIIWGPNEIFSHIYSGGFSEDFVEVGKNKCGIMDIDGNIIIDLEYDSCYQVDNGLTLAQDGETYYIYDVSNAKPDSSTLNIKDVLANNPQAKSNRNRTYDKVIQAYNALKETINNPDSLQIISVKTHDTDIIFKYTATNSYGAIVTDYALYSDYQIVQGEMGSSLAHSYYISSASEEINWNDIEDYLKSIN